MLVLECTVRKCGTQTFEANYNQFDIIYGFLLTCHHMGDLGLMVADMHNSKVRCLIRVYFH